MMSDPLIRSSLDVKMKAWSSAYRDLASSVSDTLFFADIAKNKLLIFVVQVRKIDYLFSVSSLKVLSYQIVVKYLSRKFLLHKYLLKRFFSKFKKNYTKYGKFPYSFKNLKISYCNP